MVHYVKSEHVSDTNVCGSYWTGRILHALKNCDAKRNEQRPKHSVKMPPTGLFIAPHSARFNVQTGNSTLLCDSLDTYLNTNENVYVADVTNVTNVARKRG